MTGRIVFAGVAVLCSPGPVASAVCTLALPTAVALSKVALPLANTSLSLNPNRLTAVIQWAGLAKGVWDKEAGSSVGDSHINGPGDGGGARCLRTPRTRRGLRGRARAAYYRGRLHGWRRKCDPAGARVRRRDTLLHA